MGRGVEASINLTAQSANASLAVADKPRPWPFFHVQYLIKRNFSFILGALRSQKNAGSTLTDQVPPAATRVPKTSSSPLPVTLAASHLL